MDGERLVVDGYEMMIYGSFFDTKQNPAVKYRLTRLLLLYVSLRYVVAFVKACHETSSDFPVRVWTLAP